MYYCPGPGGISLKIIKEKKKKICYIGLINGSSRVAAQIDCSKARQTLFQKSIKYSRYAQIWPHNCFVHYN